MIFAPYQAQVQDFFAFLGMLSLVYWLTSFAAWVEGKPHAKMEEK